MSKISHGQSRRTAADLALAVFVVGNCILIGVGTAERMAYSYYFYVRIVTSFTAIALVASVESKKWLFLRLPLVIVAVLYNFIIPIHLPRAIWIPVNILTMILFLASIYPATLPKDVNSPPVDTLTPASLARRLSKWFQRLAYITNPRFVRWFGPEVTRVRAVICGAGALLNSLLMLAGGTFASHSESLWDVVNKVFEFFLMIGLFGLFGVWMLIQLGVFVSLVYKSTVFWNNRLVQDEVIDEWSINLTVVAGELVFVWGYFGGFS